jgi:hypothetical protein
MRNLPRKLRGAKCFKYLESGQSPESAWHRVVNRVTSGVFPSPVSLRAEADAGTEWFDLLGFGATADHLPGFASRKEQGTDFQMVNSRPVKAGRSHIALSPRAVSHLPLCWEKIQVRAGM